jgi:hypothetical protein
MSQIWHIQGAGHPVVHETGAEQLSVAIECCHLTKRFAHPLHDPALNLGFDKLFGNTVPQSSTAM